jgi:uncharacterized lipoprotein YajG
MLMTHISSFFTLAAVLLLAGCSQQVPSATNPEGRPSLKDYDNAPAAGPLFMPFR